MNCAFISWSWEESCWLAMYTHCGISVIPESLTHRDALCVVESGLSAHVSTTLPGYPSLLRLFFVDKLYVCMCV